MRERLERLRPWSATIALAATCYIPLLLTHPGKVGADTKSYLYLDPDRLLSRAWSMWDPNIGLGTVPHQNIGYLWPMGPFYWTFQHLGVPDWMAQRLWLGSILFLAGLGVRYLMRALGQKGPGVAAAMFLYALSPYVLTLGARISALLLPFTALGWMLGLAVKATRERTWVHPAWFALLVPTFGSTNATALLLVGLAPALWIPYATFVLKEIRFRQAVGVVVRIGVLTIGASLWWIVGLWCQGSFGIDVLRYTETARTVANSSSAPELMRGLGYWYFYGDDKLGSWIEPSVAYTQNPLLITLTYGIPILALLAASIVRWRHRAFFVTLIVGGLVIAIGAHPWGRGAPIAAGFEVFLRSQAGLAMRSLPRAVPLIALSLAVLTGVAIDALGQRLPRLERPAGVAFALLAIVCLPPLWLGQMVADNLQRDEELPSYWTEAATAIDSRGRNEDGIYTSRVLEVPGSDFASYRWGNTVDPITPGITDRPYVARELIPYGTPASADLLNALDRQMQEDLLDPDAIAPIARLMGAGDIVQRSDLAYERFNLARPRRVFEMLQDAPGLADVMGFGGNAPQVPDPMLPLQDEVELGADPDLPDPPQVGLFGVEGDPTIVSAKPVGSSVIVAGNGDGLVNAAAAGLIDGSELVRYAGSAAAIGGGGDDELRDAVAQGGALVVTDTNRRSGRRWGTVRETDGATETPAEGPSYEDPSDNRLPVFEGAGIDSETIAVHRGGVDVEASSYGNAITYTPEDRAAGALDDDPESAWYTAAFADARGEHIDISYDEPRTTDRIRLVQASRGVQNRWITEVEIRFDDDETITVPLGPDSRQVQGQWIDIGDRTFSTMSIEVKGTDVGTRDSYADLSAIGFADIRLEEDDLRLQESIRPPTDLLDALGEDSDDLPLAIVLTRLRARATAALRTDPETAMIRDIDLPTARSFALAGDVRLADLATDELLDQLLGLAPLDDGGIETDASRHLPGDISARPTAAIDGDPTTHWSPGFLAQDTDWTSYTQLDPVTFDHMDLQVVADGRHTVPTRLRIVADGEVAAVVDVPAVEDQPEKDATVAVPIDLPEAVTGRRIEIHIDASRPVTTLDWISNAPVVMPVGIAEWGIEGISEELPAGPFDSGCRSDLLTLDGESIPVQVTGTLEDAVAGRPLDLSLCGADSVDLPAGGSQLRTARGVDTGLHIDTLTLRSAAGGEADPSTATLLDGTDRPDPVTADVTRSDRWRRTVTVGPRPQDTWLVVGQSHNDGWRATIDGEDLGAPVLVDGYSSAFLVPAGSDPVVVEIAWRPQRVVLGGLAFSLLAALLALVLALRPLLPWSVSLRSASVRRRRRAVPEVAAVPLDEAPLPLSWDDVRLSPGTAPGWVASVALAVGCGIVGVAAINVVAGVVLAGAALATLRVDRARPVLAVGPSALLAISGAYIVVQQVGHRLPDGFEWPSRYGLVHGVAYVGVLLLGLGVLVDRLRTGSWSGTTAPPGDAGP